MKTEIEWLQWHKKGLEYIIKAHPVDSPVNRGVTSCASTCLVFVDARLKELENENY